MIDQIKFLYEAGVTRRFHTVPVIRDQNIADHSWHVAMLAHILYGQEEPGLTPAFLMACMTHDMAECRVGDLPAPAKRSMDERYTLVDNAPMDDAGAHSFRDAWGIMEQEILQPYQMDWEKFLTEEEKRRLKFCDALEGLFYCISERWLGNKTIITPFLNFTSYVGKLLEDVDDENASSQAGNEWRAFEYSQYQWKLAND